MIDMKKAIADEPAAKRQGARTARAWWLSVANTALLTVAVTAVFAGPYPSTAWNLAMAGSALTVLVGVRAWEKRGR